MDLVITGYDQCRDLLFEKDLERDVSFFRGQLIQIGMFHVSHYLDSVGTEMVVVTCKLKTGSRGIGDLDPSLLDVTRVKYHFQVKSFYDIRQKYA